MTELTDNIVNDTMRYGGELMEYVFETVTYNKNIPGKILMQDKPGRRCNTSLHWHKEIEIVYMIHGCLHIKINGCESEIRDGEFYLCNSEEVHVTHVDDMKANYTYLVVLLSYSEMKKFCPTIDDFFFQVTRSDESYQKIKSQILNILDSLSSTDSFIFLEQNCYFLNIYHTLLADCKVPKKESAYVKSSANIGHAKLIIEYINKNYRDKITLEEVSKEIGFSPQYLSKYFKKITDYSFIQYLLNVRLENAIKDIMNKNLSVTDAAYENGFTNVKSLITTCKKVYGVTPSHYKRKAVGGDNVSTNLL